MSGALVALPSAVGNLSHHLLVPLPHFVAPVRTATRQSAKADTFLQAYNNQSASQPNLDAEEAELKLALQLTELQYGSSHKVASTKADNINSGKIMVTKTPDGYFSLNNITLKVSNDYSSKSRHSSAAN